MQAACDTLEPAPRAAVPVAESFSSGAICSLLAFAGCWADAGTAISFCPEQALMLLLGVNAEAVWLLCRRSLAVIDINDSINGGIRMLSAHVARARKQTEIAFHTDVQVCTR